MKNVINVEKFWKELNDENKAKAEFLVKNSNMYNTVAEEIFDLYERGAQALNETVDKYYEECKPNTYVEGMFDSWYDNSMSNEDKVEYHKYYAKDWDKLDDEEKEYLLDDINY